MHRGVYKQGLNLSSVTYIIWGKCIYCPHDFKLQALSEAHQFEHTYSQFALYSCTCISVTKHVLHMHQCKHNQTSLYLFANRSWPVDCSKIFLHTTLSMTFILYIHIQRCLSLVYTLFQDFAEEFELISIYELLPPTLPGFLFPEKMSLRTLV